MNQHQVMSPQRHQSRSLLVENRLCFSGPESQFSLYDTYRQASKVGLAADQLMYCGMISGKKIMHSPNHQSGQVFLPHESFVIPAGGHVDIDFPVASDAKPTTCLTIEIAAHKVEELSNKMADITKLGELDHDWQYQAKALHTAHNPETQSLLLRLSHLFTKDHPDRELLIELGISELIIRLLRHQGAAMLLNFSREAPDASGLTTAINLITRNYHRSLEIDSLCQASCMSRSKLYSEFKKQLGCTPGEYQQKLRLDSAAASIRQGMNITQTCFSAGFKDLSHFSRRFSKQFGCSPREYRRLYDSDSSTT